MCYAGKGGFSFREVYEMPIYLRRYYLKMMSDAIEEERKQYENTSGKQISKPNINMPR
jgi:hypothetical protein